MTNNDFIKNSLLYVKSDYHKQIVLTDNKVRMPWQWTLEGKNEWGKVNLPDTILTKLT